MWFSWYIEKNESTTDPLIKYAKELSEKGDPHLKRYLQALAEKGYHILAFDRKYRDTYYTINGEPLSPESMVYEVKDIAADDIVDVLDLVKIMNERFAEKENK